MQVGYFGIGSYYTGDAKDYMQVFFDNNMVCISSSDPNEIYFKGIFEHIKKQDIVFLKGIKKENRRMLIRAIGVILEDKTGENDYGYKKDVNWLTPLDEEGLIEIKIIKDGGSQRIGRIFQEFNQNIIDEIDRLIIKYGKK